MTPSPDMYRVALGATLACITRAPSLGCRAWGRAWGAVEGDGSRAVCAAAAAAMELALDCHDLSTAELLVSDE
jgi:hypothetical protein